MDGITVEQIRIFIVNFASILTAGGVICTFAIKSGQKVLDKKLEPFNQRIDEAIANNNHKFKELQLQTDKNYLVRFLADVDEGTPVDTTEMEHFWFTYDNYKKNGGNSYIDHKVDKLKKEGKL